MNLVVAVDEGWGIGNKGDLLVRLKADLKNFASLTGGKTVILGSNTLATFPGGRPLKNRKNIVMNWDPDYAPEGVTVCHNLDELFEELKKEDTDNVWVIGGASMYRQLLPYCDHAYVTKIKADFVKDAFFPNLDEMTEWKCIFEGPVEKSIPGDLIGPLKDGTVPEEVEFLYTVYRKIG